MFHHDIILNENDKYIITGFNNSLIRNAAGIKNFLQRSNRAVFISQLAKE